MQFPWENRIRDYDGLRREVKARLAWLDLDRPGCRRAISKMLADRIGRIVNEKCLCQALTGSKVSQSGQRMLEGLHAMTSDDDNIRRLLNFVNAKKE